MIKLINFITNNNQIVVFNAQNAKQMQINVKFVVKVG